MSLEGKCALITGASKPIAQAIARKFLDEGAIVYLVSKDTDKTAEFAQSVDPSGEKALTMYCDFTSSTSVKELYERIDASDESVDIIVNATDLAFNVSLEEVTAEMWNRNTVVNMMGGFNLVKAFFPMMKQYQNGVFINVASLLSENRIFGTATYAASKAAMCSLIKSIDAEWKQYNIRAFNIVPGSAEVKYSIEKFSDDSRLTSFTVDNAIVNDIARVALYLTTDKAKELSGKDVPSDLQF